MTEKTQATAPSEPVLNKEPFNPKGVMQRHSKPIVYGGFCLLVIIALIFSSHGKTMVSAKQQAQQNSPQPFMQDNTENNVADFKSHLAHQQQTLDQTAANDPAMASLTPQQRAASLGYSSTGQAQPCIPGQPCNQQMQTYGYQQDGGGGQVSPEQQASQELAAKERQRAYESRFSSNLAYSRPPDSPAQNQRPSGGTYLPASMASGQQASNLVTSRAAGGSPAARSQSTFNRKPEVNIDSATREKPLRFLPLTLIPLSGPRSPGCAAGVKFLLLHLPCSPSA